MSGVLAGMAMLVGLWPADVSARSETVKFEESKCAVDPKGKVHITVNGMVFALPQHGLYYINEVSEQRRHHVPDPLDPDEPEGCPGNPIMGSFFRFNPTYEDLGLPAKEGRTGPLRRLSLVAVTEDFWGLQNSDIELAERFCRREHRRELLDGFELCFAPDADGDIKSDISVYFIADHRIYSSPFEKVFAGRCETAIHRSLEDRVCRVGYKLQEVVNLFYRFQIENLALKDLIDFDTRLRRFLADSVVEDLSRPFQGTADSVRRALVDPSGG